MSDSMTAPMLELDDAKSIYSDEEIAELDLLKIPKHIALIPDGNRRWAKEKNLPTMMGHWEGAEALTEIVRGAAELGVKTVTVYAFSTENWERPKEEVQDLMNIFELYLVRKRELLVKDGVRLNAIGDLSKLPKRVLDAFHQTRLATEHCDKINLVLAINYGARDEIKRAVAKIVEEKLEAHQITEECIAMRLDTNAYGDPELLIRTSGEMRVSNFLLWQISYAEIFSTQVLWPNFSPKELLKAIFAYQRRTRRRGI